MEFGQDDQRVRVHQVSSQPRRLSGQHLFQRNQPQQPVFDAVVGGAHSDIYR